MMVNRTAVFFSEEISNSCNKIATVRVQRLVEVCVGVASSLLMIILGVCFHENCIRNVLPSGTEISTFLEAL